MCARCIDRCGAPAASTVSASYACYDAGFGRWASKWVALCFFGDGASSEGTFHEALNIASIWKLPVVYFCENNGYAISTPASETVSVPDIAVRAAGYAMPGHVVDGQDVMAVYDITAVAVARARAGGGQV